MKLHYKGKYNLDESSLPCREHPEGAVPFREAGDMKKLSLIANGLSIVMLILLLIPVFLLYRKAVASAGVWIGFAAPLLTLFPHELLHAVCFREDVYLFTNLRQSMLFVVGTESMSRAQFVFMSMLPNLVFGIVPYALSFAISLPGLAVFGAMCTSMGAGDYYNVFHALTQMPRGAKTYMSGMHSYWYLP